MYEKRKNDERGFPRWIFWIALGFLLGVATMLVFFPSSSQTMTVEGDISLTATALVEQATRNTPDIDGLQLTATAIIAGATQTAAVGQ